MVLFVFDGHRRGVPSKAAPVITRGAGLNAHKPAPLDSWEVWVEEMPRTCTVCRHRRRQEIDSALLVGRPFRNIAKQFGTSRMALCRHKAHLLASLAKAANATEADGDVRAVGALDGPMAQQAALVEAGAQYRCGWCRWQGTEVGAIHAPAGLRCASCGHALLRIIA